MSYIKPLESEVHPEPDVLLLVGSNCPHCSAVLSILSDLVKLGRIATLEVINLEKRPDIADRENVRTVPWIRIGWFELEGLHSRVELEHWVENSSTSDGAIAYLSEVLASGRVNKVLGILQNKPLLVAYLLELLADADAGINVRLGLGVIIEELASTDMFKAYIPKLGELSQHLDARVRSDACHYLSLTNNREAIPYIKALLDDESIEVREVASESLEVLND